MNKRILLRVRIARSVIAVVLVFCALAFTAGCSPGCDPDYDCDYDPDCDPGYDPDVPLRTISAGNPSAAILRDGSLWGWGMDHGDHIAGFETFNPVPRMILEGVRLP